MAQTPTANYTATTAILNVSEWLLEETNISVTLSRVDTSQAEKVFWWTTGNDFGGGNPQFKADHNDFSGRILPSGEVNFVAGETSKTISFNVRDDKVPELDEFFELHFGDQNLNSYQVNITSPQYLISSPNSFVLFQILNDDWPNTIERSDIEGNAGQAFRLYQAAFDRTPDIKGLSYWIKMLDENKTLAWTAEQFIGSQEFLTKYGAMNNEAFINQLYLNVLDRAGEKAGIDDWIAAMNQGWTRAEVLVGFSESVENKTNVAPQIKDGIAFWQWWL